MKANDSPEDEIQFYDDVSELLETRSMMSHRTLNDIDYIPPDCDLDQYIEDMLKNKNEKLVKKFELDHERKLAQLRHQFEEDDKIIFTDKALADAAELKELNALDLNELIGRKDDFDTLSTYSKKENLTNEPDGRLMTPRIKIQRPKLDYKMQIRQAREEAARVQMKLAEEELIVQLLKENMVETSKAVDTEVIEQPVQIETKQAVFERNHHIEDALREVEQMLMQREDARSREFEIASHRQKFAKKDLPPPQLPSILLELGLSEGSLQDQTQGPWAYRPVQNLARPIDPLTDCYSRFESKVRLPKTIDLKDSSLTVLWSKEKETAEQEQRRKEEIARKLREQKLHLTKLVKLGQSCAQNRDLTEAKPDPQIVARTEKVLSVCRLQLPDQKTTTSQLKTQKVEIEPELAQKLKVRETHRDQHRFEQSLFQEHQRMAQEISGTIQAISKLLPTSELDFNEYQVLKTSQKGPQQESSLTQALELNAADGDYSRRIEVKNENLQTIDLTGAFTRYYRHLVHLDISMNKIAQVQGSFDCPNLRRLSMSDNLLKEISPFMLQKCDQLRTLNLDINQITKIANLQHLPMLSELSLQNNRITTIEGLSALTRLRRLNLSFNSIKKLEGISELQLLEYLELGKNQINDVEALTSPNNRLVFLTELYLYMNNIKSFPRNLSLPQLRLLNLNRNQELHALQIGYCPLLESLHVSYCSLTDLASLQLCPSLRDLDVSFNQIQTLPQILKALQWNNSVQFRSLNFNDNVFNQVLNDEQQAIQASLNLAQQTHAKQFTYLITKVFPNLEKFNGQYRQPVPTVFEKSSFCRNVNQVVNYRNFVTKQLSQKLFVTYFSSTAIMQLLKALLPIKVLQRLLATANSNILQDGLIFQNHQSVLRKRTLIFKLVSLHRHKKIRKQALANRIAKSPSLMNRLVKLQAFIRGHQVRMRHSAAVKRIKTEARKSTKGYKMATKLQAAFRGYLFRVKRKRALAKLNNKVNVNEFDGDFDAEAFLDVKRENLEQADIFAGGLVEKYIQVLQSDFNQRKAGPKALGATRPIGENSVGLPPLSQTKTDPKKPFDKNAGKQYFNAAGIAGASPILPDISGKMRNSESRGGSSRRNIQQMLNRDDLSEIDAKSDNRSQSFAKTAMQNNLMGTATSEKFKQHQMQNSIGFQTKNMLDQMSDIPSMKQSQASNQFYPKGGQSRVHEEEKKRQIAEEWGFEKEETMMLWEARQKKRNAIKKKSEVLTADEKLKRFMQNAKPLKR